MAERSRPGSDAPDLAQVDAISVPDGHHAAIATLRDAGAAARLPVAFAAIEALARRLAAAAPALRPVLAGRLARRVAEAQARLAALPARGPAWAAPVGTSPLAALVARLAPGETSAAATGTSSVPPRARGTPPPGPVAARPDAAALDYFRRTWARLSAEQRLLQSQSTLPDNAGPLHSHHLVHRALSLMHEIAPEYLEGFVAQVDALLWLERATGGGP